MLNFKYIRAAVVAVAFAALTWSSGASSTWMIGNTPKPNVGNSGASDSVSVLPDPMNATSTFYSLRRDRRRCASPLCGGYFVKRVNTPFTRCADGRSKRECYVAEITWKGQPENDSDQMLVRGSIVARRYPRFGNLGELQVTESWKPLGNNQPVGTFYLVRDRGVRCITFPCPTHQEAKLNSSFSRSIAGVNLQGAGLSDDATGQANAALTGPHGLIVSGSEMVVRGPGGRMLALRGTQAYVRNETSRGSTKPGSGSTKPCFKTGCSSQVCSDETVVTTCEFRPEYACYQKAACERQANGNCGFTMTPELAACLAKK
jgi:hypothetical protein